MSLLSCRAVVWLVLLPSLPFAARPAAGQDPPRFTSEPAAAGVRVYAPGAVGIVGAEAVNSSERPVRFLTTTWFAGARDRQYGREVWLPARAKRRFWYPVKPPAGAGAGGSRLEIRSLLLDRAEGSAGEDRILSRGDLPLVHTARLPTGDGSPLTAFVEDVETPVLTVAELELPTTRDTLIAFRLASGLSPRVVALEPPLPPIPESLDALDQLVLSNDRLAEDVAAMDAVRGWLHAGGRLWIQLDRVAPETVSGLLGEGFRCAIVGRTELTRVEIQDAAGKGSQPAREFELPVDLVRVVPDGVEITHTIDGWPASFWLSFGRGEVLVTTVGTPGWLHLRSPDDPEFQSPHGTARFVASDLLAMLARRFFRPAAPPLLEPDAFAELLAEQIGYRVVPRGALTAVLVSFCASLLVMGVWLARRRRLEQLRWSAPALAVAAASVLMLMGAQARQAAPPSIAVAQLLEVAAGGEELHASGLVAVYHREASPAPVAAEGGVEGSGEGGGGGFLEFAGLADGTIRRMIWTDRSRWHWERLMLPPGVHFAAFTANAALADAVTARGSFGPSGLACSISAGPLGSLSDLVVAVPAGGELSLSRGSDGTLSAGREQVLPAGQYIDGFLLNDRERRRQLIYRKLFADGGPARRLGGPVVLGWSDPLEIGFAFPEGYARHGAGLVAIPLVVEPTPPDTPFLVPAPFIPYESVEGPEGGGPSSIYDNRSRQWVPASGTKRIWMRFQLPAEILPARVERAALTVRTSGAVGAVQLVGEAARQAVALERQPGSAGSLRFELDRADVLGLDTGGGLVLGLDIEASGPEVGSGGAAAEPWRIESLGLEAAGRTIRE